MPAIRRTAIVLSGIVLAGAVLTWINLKPAPKSFHLPVSDHYYVQILDRHGEPLNTTYQNNWNVHNDIALHQVPEFLKQAFIVSEDKRFYKHRGPDWIARSAALLANIKAMRNVRGASTITEQVVRMLHPRPRTVWSRWLEGFEAARLERNLDKDQILEFYLNQVPYAANRRGVVQAARYYFNRDLHTLSKKEMLALVVLVRAPSRLDLWKNTNTIQASIERLANQLHSQTILSEQQKTALIKENLELQATGLSVDAREFIQHVKRQSLTRLSGQATLKTSLHGVLQQRVQAMLDNQLAKLKKQKVHNGAVLAVDHGSAEILAWVVAGKGANSDTPGKLIDAVTVARQPGSALKPFLYSLALEKGWSAATVINDAPLTESVGSGLHSYQNYSRTFYGPVTLRQALGNSLNIPALKTLQYIGAENYLDYLRTLGFNGLDHHPNFYGDGIALGNGEVTLYQLVQAYAAIANQGELRPLQVFSENHSSQRAMRAEIASLLAHILSDPGARKLEFGEHSVLDFPIQTAVKTGTSNDYRDSWALGFNHRYTVGVWMGNLDQTPTDGVTGSTGPALLLRAVFAELNQHQQGKPLAMHNKLVKRDLCVQTRQAAADNQGCKRYTEWFVADTQTQVSTGKGLPIRLRRPRQGLHIAYDPRVSADDQAFEFYIQGLSENDRVKWIINGQQTIGKGGKYLWPVEKGQHEVQASVWRNNQQIAEIGKTRFQVK